MLITVGLQYKTQIINKRTIKWKCVNKLKNYSNYSNLKGGSWDTTKGIYVCDWT